MDNIYGPINITFDNDGNIYIPDYGRVHIQKCGKNGNFIKAWKVHTIGSCQDDLSGITFFDNSIYTCDYKDIVYS